MAQLMKIVRYLVLACAVNFVTQVPSFAQNLPDPTKPPAGLLQSEVGVETPSGPVLQSILISPHRKIAIIDGQTVQLNGKFGNQTLVRMTESEVVLKSGRQLQTLSLHPDFSKKKVRGTQKLN
jgi:MSHA biogenesis protein MshK